MKFGGNIEKISISLLILFAFFTGIFVFFSDIQSPSSLLTFERAAIMKTDWYYTHADSKDLTQLSLPAKIPAYDHVSRLYHDITPDSSVRFLGLVTDRQNLKVLFEDKILYQSSSNFQKAWHVSYKSRYHIVKIPENLGGRLCLELTALTPGSNGLYSQVFLGSKLAVYYSIFKAGKTVFFRGILAIVLGLCMLFTSCIVFNNFRKTAQSISGADKSLLYMFLSLLLFGFWQLEDSGLLQFVFGYQPMHWILEFLPQPVIMLLLFLLVREFAERKKNIPLKILFFLNSFVFILIFFLQFTCVIPMSRPVRLSLYVMVIDSIVSFLLVNKKNNFMSPASKIVFNTSILIGAIPFVLFAIFKGSLPYAEEFLNMAFLCIIVGICSVVFQKTFAAFRSEEEKELFTKYSFTDFPTGIPNRAAWHSFVYRAEFWKTKYPKQSALFLFRLNFLAEINHDYGEFSGDDAILAVSSSLTKTFADEGRVYRLGGDDFLVYCVDMSEKKVLEAVNRFSAYIKTQKESSLPISVSYGWTLFVPKWHKDFDAACRAAWKDMMTRNADKGVL